MTKILLLEDNHIDAFIAEKVLKLSGAAAELEIVERGAKALTLLTNRYLETGSLPDVILVDFYMPEMDGLQFLDAFASMDMKGKEHIVLIMLTNSADPHLTAEAIRLGARGSVTKPLTLELFAEFIELTRATSTA